MGGAVVRVKHTLEFNTFNRLLPEKILQVSVAHNMSGVNSK